MLLGCRVVGCWKRCWSARVAAWKEKKKVLFNSFEQRRPLLSECVPIWSMKWCAQESEGKKERESRFKSDAAIAWVCCSVCRLPAFGFPTAQALEHQFDAAPAIVQVCFLFFKETELDIGVLLSSRPNVPVSNRLARNRSMFD